MSFYTGKNVLVTGAAGLVGHSTVKRLLADGAYVRATVKTRPLRVSHPNLQEVKCDLTNMAECENVVRDMDIVINSAAFIRGAGRQADEMVSIVRNNLYPTINIIDASIRAGNERFVFIGSSTMYPDVMYPVKEEEGFIGEPHISYEGVAWVKRYCEKLCMHYHRITKTKFAITRTTAIYGPHDNFTPNHSHVIPDLIVKAERRENPFLVWGDGTQIRDFIYVEDLVDGMLLAGEKKADADPINIATGTPTTVTQLVTTITEQSGYTPTFQFDTSKPVAIPYRMVSVEKAKALLNWSAPTPLNVGIKNTIDWYRSNIKN